MIIKQLFITALGCLLALKTTAQPRPVLTLKEALTQALSRKQSLTATRTDAGISSLQTAELQSRYWPVISLAYTYQYNPLLPSSIIPLGLFNPALPPDTKQAVRFGTTWTQTAGVTVSQSLFDATLRSLTQESRIWERISAAQVAGAEDELIYEVTKTYIAIWQNEQQSRTAAIDTLRTDQTRQILTQRAAAGRVLATDVNTAVINHRNAVQQFRNSVTQWLQNRIYLTYLMGRPTDDVLTYGIDSTTFTPARLTLLSEPAKVESMPGLVQLTEQIALARQQETTLQKKYLPSLTLNGFLGVNQFSNQFSPVQANSWFGNSYVNLSVAYRVLSGENKANKQRQLQEQQQSLGHQLADRRDALSKDRLTALNSLNGLEGEIMTLQANVNLSTESVGLLQLRFHESQLSALELNNQELDVQKLRSQLQQKEMQRWTYWLDYVRASGLLSRLLP
jgi:outer membrane protein